VDHGYTRTKTVLSDTVDPAHVAMPGVHRIRDVLLTSVSEGAPPPVADEGDNPDGGASPATAEPTDDAEPAAAVTDAFSFAPSPDFEFDECDALQPFIDAGRPVFNAEYADSFFGDANARAGMCADALASSFRTLVLPLDLDDSFRFSCDP